MPSALHKRYEQDCTPKEKAFLERVRVPVRPRINCTQLDEEGEPCTKESVYLSDPPLCAKHGGRYYSNFYPNWLTNTMAKGRWAPHLRKDHQERFFRALEDNNLLSLEEDLSLLDARIVELLTHLDTGETGSHWAELSKIVGAYEKTKARYFKTESLCPGVIPDAMLLDFMERILRIVSGGVNEYLSWREIREILAERKSLGESERRRIIEAKQMMTIEQAEHMKRMIFEIIKKEVPDTAAVGRIAQGIMKLTNEEQLNRANSSLVPTK